MTVFKESIKHMQFRFPASIVILCFFLFLSPLSLAAGLIISPAKEAMPFIEQAFPNATRISEKQGDPATRIIYQNDDILGYAFETNDIENVPAYSGEPINTLVIMNSKAEILKAHVLEHHEPILLVGIPEQTLFDFASQYEGIAAGTKVKVGADQHDGTIYLDGVSGATVTVMVVNMAVMKSASKVAIAQGILEEDEYATLPKAIVKQDLFTASDWATLTGDGSIRRLHLKNEAIDQAFKGTKAEDQDVSLDEKQNTFAELYFAQLDIPTIGRNLLGDSEYEWMMSELQPGEHVLGLMGNGYSFKGSGYVRGGIFDRIIIHQGDNEFSFRDVDHYRINDLYAEGTPYFKEMSMFFIREHQDFDPGQSWQLEFLVRRQIGPTDGVFTSFKADALPLEKYYDYPAPPIVEEELKLWEQVWQDRTVAIYIVLASMFVLLVVLFFQDWLVKFPRFLHQFRIGFLIFTVCFIGWYCKGQLSVVNVLTFLQSLMNNFNWETFLLDPVIFVLWVFVAATVLLWGRGVYCGWLCPFGALQELLGEVAVRLRIPQLHIPFSIHERLWAVKYLILLGLFGLSLESLAVAETYAEVEPFKTTFLLNFDRDWPFITYALGLLIFSIFNRKFYCRYICPMGAAIAIPSFARLFDWLKRRKECGKPCQLCAQECEIGAIVPTGEINMRECHYCLDCQMTYHNKDKCPPLIKKYRKATKVAPEPVNFINP